MLQYIPAGVAQLDKDYHLVLANVTARRYLDMLGTATVDEHILAVGGTPIKTLLTPRVDGLPHEVAAVGRSNQIFTIRAHALPTSEAGGWVLLIEDVTAERQWQGQQAQQERLAAMERLVAGVANEFHGTLCSMIGYVELLQMQTAESQVLQHDLATIAEWGQRGLKMARHLLDFSGQAVTRMRPHDMQLILTKLLPHLERTLPDSIRMRLDSAPGPYEVKLDVASILQLLLNLTLNARDAMPKGGELCFSLSPLLLRPGDPRPFPNMCHGKWVSLTVSDTGEGMPPVVQTRLFDPFFTTQIGMRMGLGLTQVYSIMKQHDGYITVESMEGCGTRFALYFPSWGKATDAIQEAVPEDVTRGQGEMLVVVDSDFSSREALRLTLRYLGYHVLTAANGEEALAMCRAHDDLIALVLSTLVPTAAGGGLALVSDLRQRYPYMKVIALVEASHWAARHELLAQGATTCLLQPPDFSLLARAVSQALEIYH